jgi:hypothetical protein
MIIRCNIVTMLVVLVVSVACFMIRILMRKLIIVCACIRALVARVGPKLGRGRMRMLATCMWSVPTP